MSGEFVRYEDNEAVRRVAKRWARAARQANAELRLAGAPKAMLSNESNTMSELSLAPHWNYNLFVYRDATILSASLGKTEDPEWGRSVNVMVVHTKVHERGKGLAVDAYRALFRWAEDNGYGHLVTTSGSYEGWRTHRRLGMTPWAVNGAGQIVFVAPVGGGSPRRPPPRARRMGARQPMTWSEQVEALTDPDGPYRVRRQDLPDEGWPP